MELLAQIDLTPSGGSGQFGNLGNVTISSLVSGAINIILIIAALILLLVLLGGGIAVMTSGGNPQQQGNGQKAITGAIIGLLVVFGAWAIVNLLNIFFGIDITNLIIPSASP